MLQTFLWIVKLRGYYVTPHTEIRGENILIAYALQDERKSQKIETPSSATFSQPDITTELQERIKNRRLVDKPTAKFFNGGSGRRKNRHKVGIII